MCMCVCVRESEAKCVCALYNFQTAHKQCPSTVIKANRNKEITTPTTTNV